MQSVVLVYLSFLLSICFFVNHFLLPFFYVHKIVTQNELPSEVMKKSKFVVDLIRQCSRVGELRTAIKEGKYYFISNPFSNRVIFPLFLTNYM